MEDLPTFVLFYTPGTLDRLAVWDKVAEFIDPQNVSASSDFCQQRT